MGYKSILLKTVDAGKTWTLHKLATASQEHLSAEDAVASQDPVLYDVQFLDDKNGWVVGEFGRICHTTDGGLTWTEQQGSLIGGEIFDALDLPTFFGVQFTNLQNGVAAGLDGKIARTQDGGRPGHLRRCSSTIRSSTRCSHPECFRTAPAGPSARPAKWYG